MIRKIDPEYENRKQHTTFYYEEYEYFDKYVLVDDYGREPKSNSFMTLKDILECLDERFVFNGEANNEWFQDGVMSKYCFNDYCKWSLKNRLESYGYFDLYVRDTKNKTYVLTNTNYTEHTLGSKTYPTDEYAKDGFCIY